jgi:thiamine biosynthesis lipoprotein
MATRFELVMHGPDPSRLRSSGEEALAEIERLDRQLSAFDSRSDIFRINARAADEATRVEAGLFRLITQAKGISRLTAGAFDITIGPLMNLWGLSGEGRVPSEGELSAARELVGMDKLVLDDSSQTVRFAVPGMRIDLGAIGKGYAIEQAVALLVESGVTSALIHGGTSSIHAIGSPPDGDAWRVAVFQGTEGRRDVVELCDSSLSVSAVHGKSFVVDGVEYGHVIDPRTGMPAGRTRVAAVTGPSATVCDALSTALLVLGEEWLAELEAWFPGYTGSCV